MQLKQALASGVERLTAGQVPSPRMNAELLLRFVLNCDRAYLFAHPERELAEQEESHYQSALAERSRGVPAQYITGHQEFWGMDLIVTPAVLIPRPETEHVVEVVLELLGDKGSIFSHEKESSGAGGQPDVSPVRIVDVGTGSGAIALALARALPHAEIHATDNSESALEIARANAARHQLNSRIHFYHADLLGDVSPPLDLIVSNPPYVGESEEDQVQLEVRKFEPRSAVFAGATGTEVIGRMIPQAREMLRPGGWIVMEISGTIVDRVRDLLTGWENIEVIADLQSIPRVIRARKPPAS